MFFIYFILFVVFFCRLKKPLRYQLLYFESTYRKLVSHVESLLNCCKFIPRGKLSYYISWKMRIQMSVFKSVFSDNMTCFCRFWMPPAFHFILKIQRRKCCSLLTSTWLNLICCSSPLWPPEGSNTQCQYHLHQALTSLNVFQMSVCCHLVVIIANCSMFNLSSLR